MLKQFYPILGILASLISVSAFGETIYVTNTNNSGSGSLREAVVSANANPSASSILFNISGTAGSERIISLSSALPAFTAPVEIKTDAAQTGKTVLQAPDVNSPSPGFTAFTFQTGSAQSVVESITFRKFVYAIDLHVSDVTILNNHFENNQGGTDIRLLVANGTVIKSNTFTGNATAISGSGNEVVLLLNTFKGTKVLLNNASDLRIGSKQDGGNTFESISGDALTLQQIDWSQIENNLFIEIGGRGIVLEGTGNVLEQNVLPTVVGWEISVSGGHSNEIRSNIILNYTGSTFNGILLQNGLAYQVENNTLQGSSIEITAVNGSPLYGPLQVISNGVFFDSLGFSGHGAIMLTNLSHALVMSNTLQDNRGNGVLLNNASNVTVLSNSISNNGRTGVYVIGGQRNKISRNTLSTNKAYIYGVRSGIVTNNLKAAPVISSVKKIGNHYVISGTGTVANDTVEIFSSANSVSSTIALRQEAEQFRWALKATGSSWSITVPASGTEYFIATATDVNGNTSTFSLSKAVEISGPASVARNTTYTYGTGLLPNVNYQWWVNGDATIRSGQGTHQVGITFGPSYSNAWVYVGFTHPLTGWTVYQLQVNHAPLKAGSAEVAAAVINAESYPNPFQHTTKLKLDAPAGQAMSLQVYNAQGKLVQQSAGYASGDEVEIGNELPAGIYLLHVISGEEKQVIRIMKSE